MKKIQEFDARAELCRRLAELEPLNKHLWLAEAERWSRVAQTKMPHGRHGKNCLPLASGASGCVEDKTAR